MKTMPYSCHVYDTKCSNMDTDNLSPKKERKKKKQTTIMTLNVSSADQPICLCDTSEEEEEEEEQEEQEEQAAQLEVENEVVAVDGVATRTGGSGRGTSASSSSSSSSSSSTQQLPTLELQTVVEVNKFGYGIVRARREKIKKLNFDARLVTIKLDWGAVVHVMRSEVSSLASTSVGRIRDVDLTLADMWRAGSGNFLNDNCIDACMKILTSKFQQVRNAPPPTH